MITTSVQGLRVRNYTAIETDPPTPPAPSATVLPVSTEGDSVPVDVATTTPSPTLASTITVTPTHPTINPLPTNPAELSQIAILNSLGKGGLASLGLFSLLGIYLRGRIILRRPRKKSKY